MVTVSPQFMTRSRIPYNSSEIMYLGVMFKITKKTGEEKVKWGVEYSIVVLSAVATTPSPVPAMNTVVAKKNVSSFSPPHPLPP